MNADEAGKIGRDAARVVTEWRSLWKAHTARIGQERSDLAGEVVESMAFHAAKEENPDLFARSVDADAAFAELQARSQHAIARSEERWVEMDQKGEERRRRELEQKKEESE